MNADRPPSGQSESIPDEVLQTLSVRWLESFEKAARAENKSGIMQLFHETALLCGTQKGGALDSILSKNFHFEVQASKIIPHSPCALVVCPWHAVSAIVKGPTRKGDSTFYIGVEPMEDGKKRCVAYHAHFSEIK